MAAPSLDLLDPTLERSFRGHKGPVTSVAFSPTMRQLASGSTDGCVMVWNFRPQMRAFRFVGHKVGATPRRRTRVRLSLAAGAPAPPPSRLTARARARPR